MHSLRFLFAALSLAGCDAPGSTPSDVGGDGAVTDARDDTGAMDGGPPDGGGVLGTAEVHWLEPLHYRTPLGVHVPLPDEADCPYRYFVDLEAGSGSECTESAPCGALADLVGKPGTEGGPACVYVRGQGRLDLGVRAFYGAPGAEIVIRPWPGAGLVSFRSVGGNNVLEGDGVHHVVFDGGPDLNLEFVTNDGMSYGLTIRSSDITVWRARFRAGDFDGALVDIGSYANVARVRFINCELFDADHFEGAQQNMYWGAGPESEVHDGLVQNCIFRNLGGEAIEINPRIVLDGLRIEGNAIHDVGFQTCVGGSTYNCRPGIVVDGPSTGGTSEHVTIANNLIWRTASGGVWDRSGTDTVRIVNNTIYDYDNGPPGMDPNPEGIAGYRDGARGTVWNNIVYDPEGTAPFDGSRLVRGLNLCSGCDVAWASPFLSTDPDSPDFLRIDRTSPAADRGADRGEAIDYFGTARPTGAAVDLGACEAP